MPDELGKKAISNKSIDILLVENDEANVRITLRAFDRATLKNNIHVVNDGQEALDFIHHRGKYQEEKKFPTPDLILLDIDMPGLDGFEVLKKLKSDSEYGFIPVVMLTTSEEEEDVLRSYKNGAAGFITKPLDYKDFVKLVEGFNLYWHGINRLPNPSMCKK